jgi:hypothetical protein
LSFPFDFEATLIAASMRFDRMRGQAALSKGKALAVMGRGPLFGFDGGARACRTTHPYEASTWPSDFRKEWSNGTAKTVCPLSGGQNGDDEYGRR